MVLSTTLGNIQFIATAYIEATSARRIALTGFGQVFFGGCKKHNIIMYRICARAKKAIWGISSCCQPITSPMKEKKRAAVKAHCLCHKAHNVSQSKGKIIRKEIGTGTKSSTARMTKTEMIMM